VELGRSPRALGVLGGTFDPVHYAHLTIAEQACSDLDLDRILFVPAGLPPHKRDQLVTQPRHRVAMLELAIAGNPHFRLSRLEVDRAGPSYAVDTLEDLAARSRAEGRPEPVMILSAEALRGLNTWRDPDRLLDLCRVAVVPRRGYPTPGPPWFAEHFPGREGRFAVLAGPDLGHSASDIRRRASEGRTIRYLVPEDVEAYIAEHDLYPPQLWSKN
jgi:nicotinate-nucleotide adenylyltransferase